MFFLATASFDWLLHLLILFCSFPIRQPGRQPILCLHWSDNFLPRTLTWASLSLIQGLNLLKKQLRVSNTKTYQATHFKFSMLGIVKTRIEIPKVKCCTNLTGQTLSRTQMGKDRMLCVWSSKDDRKLRRLQVTFPVKQGR